MFPFTQFKFTACCSPVFIVASGEFLSGLDSKSTVFQRVSLSKSCSTRKELASCPGSGCGAVATLCCRWWFWRCWRWIFFSQFREVETAKGKAAKQTQQKVLPLPKFLCVCKILTLVLSLWALGSLWGKYRADTAGGWNKNPHFPFGSSCITDLQGMLTWYKLEQWCSGTGNALGPVFLRLPMVGCGAAAKGWHGLSVPHGDIQLSWPQVFLITAGWLLLFAAGRETCTYFGK